MKPLTERYPKGVVPANGALFALSFLTVRLFLAVFSLSSHLSGGYEPLFFFVLASVFCFLATAFLCRRKTESGGTNHAGLAALILFAVLPDISLAAAPSALLLFLGTAAVRDAFRKASPAACLLGCAVAAGVPEGPYLFFLNGFFRLLAVSCLCFLFPAGQVRKVFPAALILLLAGSATGVFLLRQAVPGNPLPSPPVRTDAGESDLHPKSVSLRNLMMLACAQYGGLPDSLRYADPSGWKTDLRQKEILPLLLRPPFTGRHHDIRSKLKGDFLFPPAEEKTDDPSRMPRIFLLNVVHPANFVQNYFCTEDFFRHLKKKLPENAILGVVLGNGPDEFRSSVLSSIRSVFRSMEIFHFPETFVLASDGPLSDDPDVLDARAGKNQVYEKFGAPEHLLAIVLPYFQDESTDAALQDAALRTPSRRADSLPSFRTGPTLPAQTFSRLTRYGLLIFGGLASLYLVLRYWTGWKPERKSAFRLCETGFLAAGIPLICVMERFRHFNLDPEHDLQAFLCLFSLAATWAFISAAGEKRKLFFRWFLPGGTLLCSVLLPDTPYWTALLTAAAAGFPFAYALDSALQPLPEGNVPEYAALFGGAAFAAVFVPPAFFHPWGIGVMTCVLLLILFTRRA